MQWCCVGGAALVDGLCETYLGLSDKPYKINRPNASDLDLIQLEKAIH